MAQHTSLIFRILLGGGVFLSVAAQAVDLPSGNHSEIERISPYAQGFIQEALFQKGLKLASDPEGKEIERIEVVPFDVITSQDPWPLFASRFHFLTQSDVVERELLLHAGDRWSTRLAQETERNLRANLFVSLSHVVACQGSTPEQVVLLVVTKDLWSLRPGISLTLVGNQLQYLGLKVTEQNLLGRRKVPGIDFALDPATFLFGQRYWDPRIWGSRFYLSEQADFIWNRTSGAFEGGLGVLAFGLPLYSLASRWAFQVEVDFSKDIYREFTGGGILSVPGPNGESALLQYRQEVLKLQAQVQRSYGTQFKLDVTAGWKGWSRSYSFYSPTSTPSFEMLSVLQQSYLPRTESAGTLFGQIRFFEPQFFQIYNVERFEVPEDIRVGPDIRLETRVATPAFGFSQSFFEPELQADWVLRFADTFLSFGARGRARFQPGLVSDTAWVNQVYTLNARVTTSPVLYFRLVAAVAITRRFYDLNRELDTLGGNENLRGFPVSYLFGQQKWTANIEVRSLPVTLWAFRVGLVSFLDLGNAFGVTTWGDVFGSTGFGFRVGIPQFNRFSLRMDFGFPIIGVPVQPTYFTLSFGQAF